MTPELSTVLAFAAAGLVHYTAPSRRTLVSGVALAGLARALDVHAPCTLSAAVLVAADGLAVPLPGALLAAAIGGLLSIAEPRATPIMAGVLTVALLAGVLRGALRGRGHAAGHLEQAARLAFTLTVATYGWPGLDGVRGHSVGVAGTAALVSVALHAHARLRLSERRRQSSSARASARAAATAAGAIATAGTQLEGSNLDSALRRIVHELRQPVGAASTALLTAELPGIDPTAAAGLRNLATSELRSALESLEVLARFSRAGRGEPVDLPLADAVVVALGPRLGEVVHTGECTARVCVDPSQLAHALQALVQNALDAAPHDRPEVAGLEDGPAGVAVVRIVDRGVALDSAVCRAATTAFFTTRAGHLGLGASFAARFAASIGGSFALFREGDRTVAELRIPTVP